VNGERSGGLSQGHVEEVSPILGTMGRNAAQSLDGHLLDGWISILASINGEGSEREKGRGRNEERRGAVLV
jgi:hypothetical protein